jgi:endonuclease YncB( thermonuclease family)
MNYRRWLDAAKDHAGSLRLAVLMAIAASLIAWHTFEPATGTRYVRQSSASPIVGYARVVDGDTIDVSGIRIRLYGIDAPESAQTCVIDSQSYRCGERATLALIDFVRGQTVRCEPTGLDPFRRVIARCRLDASDTDINSWLVREGFAVAYRHYSYAYILDELHARVAGRGLWAGTFEMPWDYRAEAKADDVRHRRFGN